MSALGVARRAGERVEWSAWLVLAMLLVACGPRAGEPRGVAQQGSIAADSDRFPHALHTGNDPTIRAYAGRGLGCADCHPSQAVVAGQTARPGSNQHAPCDQCHKDEFYKPPGAFCRNCHIAVDPTQAGKSPLQPYPERGLEKALASVFSHRLHLDPEGMEAKVGFHVDCVDCHARDGESRDPAMPTHAACARCHTGKDAAKRVLAMDECGKCHAQRDVDLRRGRKLISDDLVFSHAAHEVDLAGDDIGCKVCHDGVPASRRAEDVSVPAMQRCATCHEDAEKTPERVRIASCGVCHQRITAGVAPRNHLTGSQVPEDHTIAFRKDHGEQAGAKDARCGYCHSGLSGSPKDSCNDCHRSWAPRDHDLGWREDAHGEEAVVDRDRCATCHTAEYCVGCHAIPPRSHRPMGEFRRGGHAEMARFATRSCFACHTFEDTCSSCHRGQR